MVMMENLNAALPWAVVGLFIGIICGFLYRKWRR